MIIENCQSCKKVPALCLCGEIKPQVTKTQVVILQHPQEEDHELGSALLTHLSLPNSIFKIGLSWRSLSAVLEKEKVDHARWAVLYLGSGIKGELKNIDAIQFVSKQGTPIDQPNSLDGIVILDGSWSQAKALWWRNAWLLKLRRIVLTPKHKSLYKELRKEPRRECLSTIESVAEVLEALGEKKEVSEYLRNLFFQLLDKKRTLTPTLSRKQAREL